ncbi:ATP-binding cassette sub-family G member 8 isoform X1 [Toxorhynchites rutilus septentrionalis]|uniref:ATP-binding cassette sub-family G member 8 isoform X1 n=1 Tax=Toxorhynchites rutilus septentrionalis TaxID=329112 RepID=UPI0024787663|nr:ATP-binding cassette sub-family G member 8 isoform X1 [Toxorhynchites rutilus septentrionalis]
MELRTMTTPKQQREDRRFSVPHGMHGTLPPGAADDLHAWSIYRPTSISSRQNLNSDFADSALGSSDKSPQPYSPQHRNGYRDEAAISNHPRYGGSKSNPLNSNMYTYLKFGLPRVFPPNGGQPGGRGRNSSKANGRGRVNRGYRDSTGPGPGSSGYDSSDNETNRGRVPANLRKYRSESDFRAIGAMTTSRPSSRAQGIPLAALKQANSRASIAGTHVYNPYATNQRHHNLRSQSEADLLAEWDYDESPTYGETRLYPEDIYNTQSRRHSIAGLVYPNIQVHCLDVSPGLRGVSLQAKAGDLFAIMATSQREGTVLVEALAGVRQRMSGEILVNGQQVNRRILRQLCGYVPSLDTAPLDPRMSVQSTLSFHAALRGPYDRSDLKERVDILVEDLGLTAVRSANVSRLTHSEKQRLNVACQLLTQSSILLLDQTTVNMDIFDTFFLVEYLRQWCSAGRMVIMTLQPPTFEILSMCSGVLLLSGGRTVYSGSRADLPRHMGQLGYPCPPFKNPADYYLDLVTLDDLSAAALLESSARIESLANSWDHVNSEPPLAAPVANLPEPTRSAGFFGQINALAKRYMSYKQPGSLLNWISRLILAAVLSLFVGCIFWDVPTSDPQLNLNDRLGFLHCIMVVFLWPMLILQIRDIQEDRRHAEKDLRIGLYGRFLYIIIQTTLCVLPSLCIWLAYLLPAHSMAGLYSSSSSTDTGIYLYMGYMLLYLMAIQTIVLFIAHLVSCGLTATIITALLVLFMSSVGGYSVHSRNVPDYMQWSEVLSPEKWMLPLLTEQEYSPETIAALSSQQMCRNKQVQHQEIIVQQPCPPPNGTAVLTDHRLLARDHVLDPSDMYSSTVLGLLLTCIVFFALTMIIFLANCQSIFRRRMDRRQKRT